MLNCNLEEIDELPRQLLFETLRCRLDGEYNAAHLVNVTRRAVCKLLQQSRHSPVKNLVPFLLLDVVGIAREDTQDLVEVAHLVVTQQCVRLRL